MLDLLLHLHYPRVYQKYHSNNLILKEMINEFKDKYGYVKYCDPDGTYIGNIITSPLAIHTPRFDIYREWNIIKVLVFESFIIYSQIYGNPFFKTRKYLIDDLRLTKYTLLNTLDSLIQDGYISKSLSGKDQNFKNFYTVNYDEIIKHIDDIYRLEIFEEIEVEMYTRELYNRLFESYKFKSEKLNESELYYRSKHRKK